MNLNLNDNIATGYSSPSQKIRVLTERWVAIHAYCPSCSSVIHKTPNNSRVLDFLCASCDLTFELKSKKGQHGSKIVDGAYRAMVETISSGTQPNFFLLSYDSSLFVRNLMLIPKRFIVPEFVEKRRPLTTTARRAGWIGCNLLLSMLPPRSMIYYVKNGQVSDKKLVRSVWQSTAFLDDVSGPSRGWTIAVMGCIESLRRPIFTISDLYAFVPQLERRFPKNRNVKAKIRQQLQLLRNRGWLTFEGQGVYSMVSS